MGHQRQIRQGFLAVLLSLQSSKVTMPALNRELWPMLGLQVIVLALITMFPQISLLLALLMGRG